MNVDRTKTARIDVPPALRAFIADRIRRYPQEARTELHWLIPYVGEHNALPLFNGWTETLGIRADGEMIRWTTEDWPGAQEFVDPTWVIIALVQGAKLYPELAVLIPDRPSTAIDCEVCKGTGDPFHAFPEKRGTLICACGGVGWTFAKSDA